MGISVDRCLNRTSSTALARRFLVYVAKSIGSHGTHQTEEAEPARCSIVALLCC
jgi:hypothetical protein